MSLEEIREKFIPGWKLIEDFVPVAFKEEGERFKRKGLRLEQDSAKKIKTLEEVSEEDLKVMMQLVLVEEVYVEALQHFDREDLTQLWTLVRETLNIRQATSDKEKELWVELKRLYEPDVDDQLWTHTQALMHDPVEWRLYETCGVHHVLSRDQEIFMLVEKDYPLRKGLTIVMISNKLQVENYSQMASDLIQKIHKIANSIPTASDEFPLPDYFPTACEDGFPLLSKRDAPAKEVCTADEVMDTTYLQNEHYALWEVIEFVDSYEALQVVADIGSASEGSAKKKGRTVARNRSILDTMSLDDLYNHLKVYEPKVQKKSESNSQNMAFISLAKTSSGKEEVNTASFSTASTQVKYKDINQIDEDDIEEMDIKWNMALLSMRADRFWKKIEKKITIQGTDVAGFDKSKVECFNYHKTGHFARECRALRSQDRGWDWSYMANEEEAHALVADQEAPTEFALMAKSSSDTEVEAKPVEFKNQEIKFCEKIRGLKFKVESKDNRIERLTKELEELKKEKKSKVETVRKPSIKYAEMYRNTTKSPKFDHFAYDCGVWEEQGKTWPKNNNTHKMRTQFRVLRVSTFNTKFPTVNTKFSTGNSKLSTADLGNKGKAVKASACWIWKPKQNSTDKGPNSNSVSVIFKKAIPKTLLMTKVIGTVVDLGGGKITGKGVIKTGKLEIENVYFVKDLKYNLFSVSQIYDYKNSVLFTDSECIVLGRDFMLRDDTNLLLRTFRQHNMYSIDFNNIVHHKDLTCLVAKASTDESVL
nr:ribonuclease H-like domain-containing protein [Tanacetum cinerariifolium]